MNLFKDKITKEVSDNKTKQTVKKVKVAEVAHTIFYAPWYAAIRKGFFKKNLLLFLVNK